MRTLQGAQAALIASARAHDVRHMNKLFSSASDLLHSLFYKQLYDVEELEAARRRAVATQQFHGLLGALLLDVLHASGRAVVVVIKIV